MAHPSDSRSEPSFHLPRVKPGNFRGLLPLATEILLSGPSPAPLSTGRSACRVRPSPRRDVGGSARGRCRTHRQTCQSLSLPAANLRWTDAKPLAKAVNLGFADDLGELRRVN